MELVGVMNLVQNVVHYKTEDAYLFLKNAGAPNVHCERSLNEINVMCTDLEYILHFKARYVFIQSNGQSCAVIKFILLDDTALYRLKL